MWTRLGLVEPRWSFRIFLKSGFCDCWSSRSGQKPAWTLRTGTDLRRGLGPSDGIRVPDGGWGGSHSLS